MACVDKIPQFNEESEMEEGEIVDELDDLSDISSEEEFLLRQRLEVLENYNNVLERKKAKRSSMGPGTKPKRDVLCDLSDVSANELEDTQTHVTYKNIKVQRHVKRFVKPKRRKDTEQNVDENNVRRKKDKKKSSRSKKRLGVKVISISSDESEDEYRNKRKKLADAVIVNKGKIDKSSLSTRLHNMLHGSDTPVHTVSLAYADTKTVSNHNNLSEGILSPISSVNTDDPMPNIDEPDSAPSKENNNEAKTCESVDLFTDDDDDDDDVKIISNDESPQKIVSDVKANTKIGAEESEIQNEKDSDEDLEMLRQHALKSKPSKPKTPETNETENKLLSEDEDSDTAELRLICLKSALLKKAIEMKQKQKLQKKLSQSSNLEDDLFNDQILLQNKTDSENNTDVESVDMDMGSDAEEKLKDGDETDKLNNTGLITKLHDSDKNSNLINGAINNLNAATKEDELEEDEDLLRAKLLTSLSKNLPHLVNPSTLKTIQDVKHKENSESLADNKTTDVPAEKRFIIKLDESDSEGEHEATKNLTKMHMKLSEQVDFQQKLDLFLKSTRMEVENTKLPDVVQKQVLPKKPEKFVAKAVNHLPKSEQIEYKNLVRRMAELEKIKQSRQATMNLINQTLPIKDTLKSRNVTIDTQTPIANNLDEQIAKSRKMIAEESAKMLKLKEEATKLSQKYKIAATELRNIATAITLNKRDQRAIQNRLSKIRLQHQSLLKSSTNSLHSKINGRVPYLSYLSNKVVSNKLQKENNPKDEYKNLQAQKTLRISVVNDFKSDVTINNPRLSVQIDVANNKKVVKMPTSPVKDIILEVSHNIEGEEQQSEEQNRSGNDNDPSLPKVEKGGGQTEDPELVAVCDHGNKRYYISVDDYKSPLDALGTTTWQADPNAILCPFEVGGQCKDPDCKYLHTTPPEQ